MCNIPCAFKICKLVRLTSWGVWSLQAIITSEGNKRRSGNFLVTGEPVLAGCKTPLTRKALSCLYFWKTKSEELIVSDLFRNTGPAVKRRMHPCCQRLSLHLEQSFYQCLYNDLVVVLSGFHTNRNKLKGNKDFNWNNIGSGIGLASLWFVWFCRHAWFRLMVSCRLVITTCYHENPHAKMR